MFWSIVDNIVAPAVLIAAGVAFGYLCFFF